MRRRRRAKERQKKSKRETRRPILSKLCAVLLRPFRGQHSEKMKRSAWGNWDPREGQQPFQPYSNGLGDCSTTLRRLLIGAAANDSRYCRTIRGYLKTVSNTFVSFNLPSRSTSTSSSANAVRSDFADAVADALAAAVKCKEFKYASKSDTDAADSDTASLPFESVSASALALSLEML